MMDMTNRQSNTISLDYKYFLSLLINNDKFFKTGTLQSDKSPIIFWKIWISSIITRYMFFSYNYNIRKWTFKNIRILGSNIIRRIIIYNIYVQDYSFLYIMLFLHYMWDLAFYSCGKHFHDRIILLRGGFGHTKLVKSRHCVLKCLYQARK
jgi:hypothetical protein